MAADYKSKALQVLLSHLQDIEPYIKDDSVSEIMINAPDEIWVERCGQMEKTDLEIKEVRLQGALRALATANNKKEVEHVMDARMPGYRIASAIHPVGVKGTAICIRKHSASARRLDDYLNEGAFVPVVMEQESSDELDRPSEDEIAKGGDGLLAFFRWAVQARKNIVVAGATDSGKTTFMNALLSEIPNDNRVLTIEDTAELKVTVPNHVGFETLESKGVTIRSLVRLALRFRPDRIIVGEVRGPEAYDLLDAMGTGHPGGFCSLHADDPVFALGRLETMAQMHPDAQNLPPLALRQKISDTFHYVVYCQRRGGVRRPVELAEVLPLNSTGQYQLKTLYKVKGG